MIQLETSAFLTARDARALSTPDATDKAVEALRDFMDSLPTTVATGVTSVNLTTGIWSATTVTEVTARSKAMSILTALGYVVVYTATPPCTKINWT
jgi:predicted house-cleaning NTP pyrophosphatase (Maf/HAM1 superfamily)